MFSCRWCMIPMVFVSPGDFWPRSLHNYYSPLNHRATVYMGIDDMLTWAQNQPILYPIILLWGR